MELSGKTGGQFAAVTCGVAGLVDSGYEVVDPGTKACRPVRWGDIAVLRHYERPRGGYRADARVLMKMSLQGTFECDWLERGTPQLYEFNFIE